MAALGRSPRVAPAQSLTAQFIERQRKAANFGGALDASGLRIAVAGLYANRNLPEVEALLQLIRELQRDGVAEVVAGVLAGQEARVLAVIASLK